MVDDDGHVNDALAARATIRALVRIFAEGEDVVRASFANIVQAEDRINAAFSLGDKYAHIKVDATYRGTDSNFNDPDRAIVRMRRLAWGCIVDRLEIRRAMSIARYAALEKRIESEDPPELSEENVVAFVGQCAADLPTMWSEAVKEVFLWLRPGEYSLRKYKTNEKNAKLELGPKLIISWAIDTGYGSSGGYHVNYNRAQNFVALDNVFSGLDGKGTIAHTHNGPLADAIRASGPEGHGETDYFEFRCYRNKSLHLRFKRLDLLAKFNQLAGGLNLRPAEQETA